MEIVLYIFQTLSSVTCNMFYFVSQGWCPLLRSLSSSNAHPQVLADTAQAHILASSWLIYPGQWFMSKGDLVPLRTSGSVYRYSGFHSWSCRSVSLLGYGECRPGTLLNIVQPPGWVLSLKMTRAGAFRVSLKVDVGTQKMLKRTRSK